MQLSPSFHYCLFILPHVAVTWQLHLYLTPSVSNFIALFHLSHYLPLSLKNAISFFLSYFLYFFIFISPPLSYSFQPYETPSFPTLLPHTFAVHSLTSVWSDPTSIPGECIRFLDLSPSSCWRFSSHRPPQLCMS